jgi:hypothetical protein
MPPQKQNKIGQTEKNEIKGKIGPERHAIKLWSPSLTLRYDKLECFCSATTLIIMPLSIKGLISGTQQT